MLSIVGAVLCVAMLANVRAFWRTRQVSDAIDEMTRAVYGREPEFGPDCFAVADREHADLMAAINQGYSYFFTAGFQPIDSLFSDDLLAIREDYRNELSKVALDDDTAGLEVL